MHNNPIVNFLAGAKNYSGHPVLFGGKTVESEYSADSLSALHEGEIFFADGEDDNGPAAVFVNYGVWRLIQKEIEAVELAKKDARQNPGGDRSLATPFNKELFRGTGKVEEVEISDLDELEVYEGNLRLFRTQWRVTSASDHSFSAYIEGDLYDALEAFSHRRFVINFSDQSVVIYDNYVE